MGVKKHGKKLVLIVFLSAMIALISACSSPPSTAYTKALDLFADGEYEQAAAAFERLGDYQQSALYHAYSYGLFLYEAGSYTEAEPYFAKCRGFMLGESRYQYCHGCLLEENGKYAEAAKVFLALGEYEDAGQHYQYCLGREMEASKDYENAVYAFQTAGDYADASDRLDNLQSQIYTQAVLLQSQTNYEDALYLFTLLKDYRDSSGHARECKQYFREQKYAEAERLLAEGDYMGAYEVFKGIGGYSDAEIRAEEIRTEYGIEDPQEEN